MIMDYILKIKKNIFTAVIKIFKIIEANSKICNSTPHENNLLAKIVIKTKT